jgi:hypothetical protein
MDTRLEILTLYFTPLRITHIAGLLGESWKSLRCFLNKIGLDTSQKAYAENKILKVMQYLKKHGPTNISKLALLFDVSNYMLKKYIDTTQVERISFYLRTLTPAVKIGPLLMIKNDPRISQAIANQIPRTDLRNPLLKELEKHIGKDHAQQVWLHLDIILSH